MRERRGRKANHKTLDSIGEDETHEITGKEGKGFFACYLLTSLSPRHKGQTYIGFTVNPKRRIRQHNGEITSGAWRTKKKRPWEMVLCIYGFPTNISALQFEWAWQHPRESLAVREAAMAFKSFSGIASKIKLAYTMLNLKAWNSLNLTVNYFSTKYAHHGGVSPSLPLHMKVQVCPMDDLPFYNNSQSEEENEERPDSNEEEEEEDGSNQSQPWDNLDHCEKELCNRQFQKAKEPVNDDRLLNFTGFGLLEETVEYEEASHSTVGSIETMEKEPETVENEASHSNVGSIEAIEKVPETVFNDRLTNFTGFGLLEEIVEDEEASHSTVESIKAMEKEHEIVENEASHSNVGSIEAIEKEPETVFNDRLSNFSGFGLEDSDEEEALHSRVRFIKAMEKECRRRRKPISSTTEVEVIDLMTPSPNCRVGSSKKRRRVSEFIDLTMSPNFIEL